MRKSLIAFFLIISGAAFAQAPNTLTDEEKKGGWTLLFDGKTTAGWHTFKKQGIGSAWKVQDGILFFDDTKNAEGLIDGGDIATDKTYENFEFAIEWIIAPCGNSGIIFNAAEEWDPKSSYRTGPEMQIVDNACHPDGKIDKHRAGDLFDLMASKQPSEKPVGEWNQVKILSDKGHLELWMNKVKVVETTMFGEEWKALINASKFKDWPDFGKSAKGKICLQDHGNRVSFRNIKIREIK